MSGVDRWTVVARPNADPRVRLFRFPYAGGSAAIYRIWGEVLPPDIEVQAVQLPGREWRLKEEPYTRVLQLVEELAVVLKGLFETPFAFFGHSLGAAIAFELARELRRLGLPAPEHLFLSGHRAPQLPKLERDIHDDRPKLEPWAEHTTREFKLRMVPGGHFFVNEARDLILRAVFQDLMPVQRRHA